MVVLLRTWYLHVVRVENAFYFMRFSYLRVHVRVTIALCLSDSESSLFIFLREYRVMESLHGVMGSLHPDILEPHYITITLL